MTNTAVFTVIYFLVAVAGAAGAEASMTVTERISVETTAAGTDAEAWQVEPPQLVVSSDKAIIASSDKAVTSVNLIYLYFFNSRPKAGDPRR